MSMNFAQRLAGALAITALFAAPLTPIQAADAPKDGAAKPAAEKPAAAKVAAPPAAVAPSAAPATNLQQHTRWVADLAFSPDGTLLATVGGESLLYRPGDVAVWDAATGARKGSFAGHDSSVWSVAFSNDGKTLATGAYDGTVKLWDVATGKEKGSVAAHPHWIRALAFVPGSGLLASASEDGLVKLWDVASATPVEKLQFKGHTAAVNAILFTTDGKTLITASDDKTIQLWDVAKGAPKAKLEGHTEPALALAWVAADKQFVSGGEDRSIKLWTIDGPKPVEMPTQRNWTTGLTASADGKQIIASGYDRTLRLIDPAKKSETKLLEGFTTTVWTVALSPDGKRLAAGSAYDSSGKIPSVRIWSVPDLKEAFPVERPASASGAKLNEPWKPAPPPEVVVAPMPAPTGTAKPAEKKPEPAKPAVTKPAEKKPEPAKPEVKKEEKKPEPAKPEAKKPEAKTEEKNPEPAKPQAAAPAEKKEEKSPEAKPAEKKPEGKSVSIIIDADGKASVAGKMVTIDQLRDLLDRSNPRELTVRISAHKNCPTKFVREVLEACQATGAEKFVFRADPEKA